MAHTWKVAIHLFDSDDLSDDGVVTTAHAVLTTSSRAQLEGYGRARCAPRDIAIPEIGGELAAARALRDLSDRLLDIASDDIAAIEQSDVRIAHRLP